MTVHELLGRRGRPFLDRAVEGENLAGDAARPDLRGYLDLLWAGGDQG
jgi:hypothetical protein